MNIFICLKAHAFKAYFSTVALLESSITTYAFKQSLVIVDPQPRFYPLSLHPGDYIKGFAVPNLLAQCVPSHTEVLR